MVERTFGSKTVITVTGDARATITIKHTASGAFAWKANEDAGDFRHADGSDATFAEAEAQALAVVTTWR